MVNDNPNGCPFTLALQVLSHRWTQYELKAWLWLNYPKDGQIFLVTPSPMSQLWLLHQSKLRKCSQLRQLSHQLFQIQCTACPTAQ